MTVPLFLVLPVPVLLRRSILAGLLALPALGLACASPSPPLPSTSSTTESAASILRPGSAVDREIRGGETQELRLPVQACQYLRLRFEQRGAKAAGSLAGPGGETLAKAGDPGRRFWRERLSLITGSAGELRWTVTAPEDGEPAGRYIVEVEELRPARPEDGDRLQAEQLMTEAHRITTQGTKEANQQALGLLRKSLGIWRKIGDRTGEIDTLVEIGWTEEERELASKAAQEALALAQAAGYRKGEAGALMSLGNSQSKANQRVEARRSLEEALRLWQEERNGGGAGRALGLLGLIDSREWKLDEAAERLSQAIPLLEDAGEVSAVASTQVNLGWVRFFEGKIQESLGLMQEALALARSEKTPDAEAVAVYALGAVQGASGNLEEALKSYEKSLELNRRLGALDYEPRILYSMGSLYYDFGDLDAAARQYGSALEASRAGGNCEMEDRARANLGWIRQAQKDPQAALEQYALVLADREILSPDLTALALHYTGAAYNALEQPDKALPYLFEALVLREINGALLPQAHTHLELGRAYQEKGEAALAAEHFEQALELSEYLQDSVFKATALYQWALLDRDRGELRQALKSIERSLQIIESVRSRVTAQKLRTSFFISKRAQYELYIDILMRLHQFEPDAGHMAAAVAASEQARARSLLDLLAEGRVDLRQGIAPDLKRREASLGLRLTSIQSQLNNAQTPVQRIPRLQEQLDQGLEELQSLEEEIRTHSRRYAEVRYPHPLDLGKIQALLDDNTALLEYFTGQDRSFLFVVTREGLQGYTMPPSRELSEKVGELRGLLQDRGRRRLHQYREKAFALYSTLLAPASEALTRKRHLLISPDGPLHFLPFEALLTRESDGDYRDLPYLLVAHTVSYTPSASVLASLREPRPDAAPPQRRFIAFADPIYGPEAVKTTSIAPVRGGPELPRLEGSRREVGNIAGLYAPGEVQVYLRESANEANVKRNPLLEMAERVHFATHGSLDEIHPWLSGLELTSGPGPEDDGKLQAYEIFDLQLDADLLVLSACQTGLGKEVTGEGIVGLTRAFLYAGARSLVVSLWPVDDGSTPDMMVSFYKGLGSKAKAEALRSSKLSMIESGYAHPYYWAPFVLIGNPD